MKTKKTGRGVGRKIEREQGKEEKRKKNVFLIQEHYVQRLWVAGLFLRHIPAYFYHIFSHRKCVVKTHLFVTSAEWRRASPGAFFILSQGERPLHSLSFLPIGNVLATSLSGKERQRELENGAKR